MKFFKSFAPLSLSIIFLIAVSSCSSDNSNPVNTGNGGDDDGNTVNPPIARFHYTIQNAGNLPTTVVFRDSSKNGFSWNWSFGDGGTSIITSPSHEYKKSGDFMVRLILKSKSGGSDTTTQKVKIPEGDFTKPTDAVIYPAKQKQLVNYWFYDIKQRNKVPVFTQNANTILNENRINGLRISVLAKDAHPSAGTVDGKEYDDFITAVHTAQNIKPNITIFASLKLHGPGLKTYPAWVLDSNQHVVASKYAILLTDYLVFMKNQGITVDVLGMDNEDRFNNGLITPEDFKNIADTLEAKADAGKFTMPKLIGPENYNPYVSWLEELYANNWGDRLDIIGTHYYPDKRPLSRLKKLRGVDTTKAIWNSEAHFWTRGNYTFTDGVKALVAIFDNFDVGMSGMCWWDIPYVNRPSDFNGQIARAINRTTFQSRPVYMDDIDGDDLTYSNLDTRAFKQGSDLIVWAINVRQEDLNSYGFYLNSKTIGGNITYTQWIGKSQPVTDTATQTSDNRFTLSLPKGSITVIRVTGVFP